MATATGRYRALSTGDNFGLFISNRVSATALACFIRFGDWNGWLLKQIQLKGLILAQNERWRRGLGMQVVRQRASHHAFLWLSEKVW